MSKMLITLILSLAGTLMAAPQLSVEVRPVEPLVNDSFYLVFTISGQVSGEPEISFDPMGVEVLGRSNQGTSQTMTYINGKMTVSRQTTYAYELSSDSARTARIRSIKAVVDGIELKHPDLSINILGQPRERPDVLAVAVPSKTEAFVGEGITVDYYLYYKVNLVGLEITTFPKLNGFTKRFYDRGNLPSERVQYDGEVYLRKWQYAARLFADKPGNLTIDPMRFKVQMRGNEGVGGFGGFGLSFGGSIRSRDLSSKALKVTIKPLPADNVPPHFTGLVGVHQFQLDLPRNKFLVNEAIEAKLTASGPGALEKMEAPVLFTNPQVEEFETKVDLSTNLDDTARKVFDFTYLTRSAFSQPARELPLAYFDPSSEKYVTVTLNIPEIKVDGKGSAPVPGNADANQGGEAATPNQEKAAPPPMLDLMPKWGTQLVAPDFSESRISFSAAKMVNFLLIGLIFLLLAQMARPLLVRREVKHDAVAGMQEAIKRKTLGAKEFYLFVDHLRQHVGHGGPKGGGKVDPYQNNAYYDVQENGDVELLDVPQMLKKLGLSAGAQEYFLKIKDSLDSAQFAREKKGAMNVDYQEKYFGELRKKLNA